MREGSRVDYDAIAEALSPDQLARALGAEKVGNGWRCPGPDHDDSDPSFSLFRDGRRTAGKCHGCDLAGSPVTLASRVWGVPMPEAADRLVRELGLNVASSNGSASEIIATYDYLDADGDLLFQAVRFFPKDFRQRRPDGNGGWKWNLKGVPRVLYRLPAVIEAAALGKTVFVCEGEKDVHAVEEAGGTATTCPMGAGKWRDEYAERLRGARVRIVADDDEAGHDHAGAVAASLDGVAESVEIFLPREGKDAADHLEAGHGLDELRPFLEGVTPDDSTDDVTPDRAFPLLSELLEDPELLEPPEEVVPRLAWRGRTTGLIGPDKSGKSTKAAHAVAALSRGTRWLGEPVAHGRAVVAAPDEAVGDTVRRLHELGADPSLVRVLALRPPDLLASLEGLLEAHPADLVVVDSLAEWARLTLGTAPEDGDAAGWGAVVRPLVHVSRANDCAVLLLHHPRRSDGQYRGSLEIAAALDCLLEMRTGQQGEDPTLRRISGRARWPVEDYSIRMDGDKYVLGAGGPIPMDARVLMDARAHPGTSRASSFKRLGGRKQSHSAAVNRLVESGGLVDRRGGLYHPDHVEKDLI